ncbi:MAG: methyltransferase domain-containing protein [Leptospirillia bacterium]
MLRILTFNWHEGYISLMGKLPVTFDIVERSKGGYDRWMYEFRPCPRGSRIVDFQTAMGHLAREEYDAIICHDMSDLLLTRKSPVPQFMVFHNRLDTMVALGKNSVDPREYRKALSELMAQVADLTPVFISASKKESWGFSGPVILPGIDPAEWGGYDGHLDRVLRIGNFIEERDLMLGTTLSTQVLEGVPQTTLGLNPRLPDARPSRNIEDLKDQMRHHRLLLHTTVEPWEDGYNFSLLEAMATGMPIVALTHSGSPVKDGINGFLADRAEDLREHVAALLSNRELALEMGAASREIVAQEFPMDRFLDSWERLINQKVAIWKPKQLYRKERGEVIDRIPAGANRILDIGCGTGAMGRGIRTRWGDVKLVGIEKEASRGFEAKAYYDRVIVEDAAEWAPDFAEESFDAIIMADVLEHVADPVALLRKYVPYLSPQGVLVLSVPNVRYHEVLAGLAHGRFDYQEQGILDRTHLRFFTRKTLVELLESTGLQVETMGANVSSEFTRMAEDLARRGEARTDIDLGAIVLRDQSPDDIRDLFVMQYLVTARRRVFGIIEKVDDMLGSGVSEGVEEILRGALGDPGLTREERGEVEIKLGEVLSRKGDFPGAREAFDLAIPVVSDERAYQGRAVIALLMGDFADALSDFKRAYEKNPRSFAALSGFGMVCQELGQYEEAVYYYDQSLGLEPGQEEILRLLVDSARAIGRPEAALARVREFLMENPFKNGFRSLYAKILNEAGQEAESIQIAHEILMRDPKNSVAHEILSRSEAAVAVPAGKS